MSFTIRNALSETLGITLNHIIRIFAILAGLIVVIAVVAVLFTSVTSGGGIENNPPSALTLFVVVVLLLIFMLTFYGALFNYFVRLGALGVDRAIGSWSALLSSGLVNGIKFFFISLLLAIVSLVISFILSFVGVDIFGLESLNQPTPEFTPTVEGLMTAMSAQMQEQMTLTILTFNAIVMFAISFVYAVFSANLTKTALDDQHSSYETPHTGDFAIVLFFIYLITLVPQLLAIATGSIMLMIILSLVLAMPSYAAIAIAHGVRHRMCAPAEADIEYQAPLESDGVADSLEGEIDDSDENDGPGYGSKK
ncbi:hypothetical protein QGN29_09000 [Temperatibacter marinus]|uniref:Uncharacterized protein n=1 Tax=Temperatibacter marinus TaxID=1456591 RepID=A0AA52EBC5_9PROT|nr:hypothetical protein [Temperatibacter marinus]WND01696.1 hypothetical protein QGN29_09000 [Temperatibacter marinus]